MKPTADWPNWPRIAEWSYPASHPALPGHFPGFPVVPGALLLDECVARIAAWSGAEVAAVREARFPGAARPEQRLALHAVRTGASARFALAVSGDEPGLVAAGTLALESA